jgi:hypothetical protein
MVAGLCPPTENSSAPSAGRKAETLLPHRSTEHAIDLETGTKLPNLQPIRDGAEDVGVYRDESEWALKAFVIDIIRKKMAY